MTRPVRIEFAGAFYHVLSRGNQKLPIFLSDDDRRFFFKCLRDAYERFGSIIHVYCLMENHYHLMMETPNAGLSRIMHLINTDYSIYFNKKHNKCGHPLQGRFKAILVQAEEYARELAPYVHLNPVRAGIVSLPENYRWSNYREYLGLEPPQPWTSSLFVLGLFSSDLAKARLKYAEYVLLRSSQKLPSPLAAAQSTGILGSPGFVERIKKMLPSEKLGRPNREVPQLRRLTRKPDLGAILDAAGAIFGPHNRLTKRAAISISHSNTACSLKELSEFYEMSISGISSVCRKLKREISCNDTLDRAIKEIELKLFG